MHRTGVLLVILGAILGAGCLGFAGSGPDTPTSTPAPTDTPTSTEPPPTLPSPDDGPETPTEPTDSASPTASQPDNSVGGGTVSYRLRRSSVPDEVASVSVTFQIVFVETGEDFGPCYREVHDGPYKPTITPIATPSGDCNRSAPISVDIAALDSERDLGTFTAPPNARGHALIVTDVTATLANGTEVTSIFGTGGLEVLTRMSLPEDPAGIAVGLQAADDSARYDYWLETERYVPTD